MSVGVAEHVRDGIATRVAAVGYDYDAQPKDSLESCQLCGSRAIKGVGQRDRFGFDAPSDICMDCGFVFINPRMSAEGYGDFYQRWYRPLVSAFSGFVIDTEKVQEEGRGYAEQVCNMIAQYACHPSRRTAIDIGGSTGDFAAMLTKRWGYQCTVLDPAPDELAIAKQSGAKVIAGLVEDFETDQQFDVVSCLQTVDHLLDPLGTLHKFRQWIAPHGILVIDFVDYLIFARHFGLEHAIKIDHPNYFSIETAAVLLGRTGFEPILSHRSKDNRHILFVCRPVPALMRTLPPRESVNALVEEFSP